MLSLKRYYLRFFAFLATLRFVVRLAGFLLATFFFFFAIALTSSHSNVYDVNYFYIDTLYDDTFLCVNVNKCAQSRCTICIGNKINYFFKFIYYIYFFITKIIVRM